MLPPSILQQQEYCNIHYMPYINFTFTDDNQIKYFCEQCSIDQDNLINIEQQLQSQNQMKKQLIQRLNAVQQVTQQSSEELFIFKQRITSLLDKEIKIIQDIKEQYKKQEIEIQQYFVGIKNNKELENKQKQIFHQCDTQIIQLKEQLKNVLPQSQFKISENLQSLFKQNQQVKIQSVIIPEVQNKKTKNKNNPKEKTQSQISQAIDIKRNLAPLKFSVIDKVKLKLKECLAVSVSPDCTQLIVGSSQIIYVYQMNQAKLVEKFLLIGHSGTITCLQFISNTEIISAATSVIFWIFSNNEWKIKYELQCCDGLQINCLKLNKSSNSFIIGGIFQYFRIFEFNQNNWEQTYTSQLSMADGEIFFIDLNSVEDLIITTSFLNAVSIYKKQEQQWIKLEDIQIQNHGARLCFTDKYQFAVISEKLLLFIYDYDQQKQIFQLQQILQLCNYNVVGQNNYMSFSPFQYIDSLGLLVVKNFQFLFTVRKLDNNKFEVEQLFQLETDYFFSSVSQSGLCIAVWNVKTQNLEIRLAQKQK